MPATARVRIARGAKRLLDRVSVKLGLSLAIVLSLIPYQDTTASTALDILFLAIFGTEFLLRVIIVTTRIPGETSEAEGRRKVGEFSLLALDLLALLSFVPWSQTSENARILRLVRLTRLLLLVKYWGPLVRDIWTVLVRRERARQILLMGSAVAILSFCGAVVLQTIGASGADINADGQVTDTDGHFGALLWWAFRQVQDPGNMIQSPLGLTVLLVSTTLTIFGIFLISFLIGLGTDVVRELMDLSRNRPLGYREHTVIIGVHPTTETLVRELVGYYKRLFRLPKYVVLGQSVDRPEFLSASDLGRIAYRSGSAEDPGLLSRIDASTAKRLVIQADDSVVHPDAETTSLLLTARQANPNALVVAEILERSNIVSAQVAGGAHAVVMPAEEFLALFVSAATGNSQRSELVRTLVTSAGCELYSYLFGWTPNDPVESIETKHLEMTFNDLVATFVEHTKGERIVPVGLIRRAIVSATEGLQYDLDFVGDAGNQPIGEVAGFIALGENFDAIQQGGLNAPGSPTLDAQLKEYRPVLEPMPPAEPISHALVCGFRPATVALCELLITKNPGIRVNLLVSHDDQAKRARAELDDYHTGTGTFARHFEGMTGRFHDAGDDLFQLLSDSDGTELGCVQIRIGDWTDHSELSGLPFATTHVGEHQLVVLMEESGRDSDGRTALAMLKMASLELGQKERFNPTFRLVAVVNEEPLGLRLQERYISALPERDGQVQVLSSRSFRSYCMFQAAVVPGFEAIYSQLLGPTGCDFLPMAVTAVSKETNESVSYAQLSASLRSQGYTLIGLQLRDVDDGAKIVTCPERGGVGDNFLVDDIHTAWVIGKRHSS